MTWRLANLSTPKTVQARRGEGGVRADAGSRLTANSSRRRLALFERLIVPRGRCLPQRADVTTAVVVLWRWLVPLPPEHIPTCRLPSAGDRTVDEMIDRNNGTFSQGSCEVHWAPQLLVEMAQRISLFAPGTVLRITL